jgi:hypothetical protein
MKAIAEFVQRILRVHFARKSFANREHRAQLPRFSPRVQRRFAERDSTLSAAHTQFALDMGGLI